MKPAPADQLELFALELHSVPEGQGCFSCSACRRPFAPALENNHYFWTWNGRQYRTHAGCYAAAMSAPEMTGREPGALTD